MNFSQVALIAALVGSASAFTPVSQQGVSTALFNGLGAGGMADTRDPDALDHDDPRKSISAAPSFEEYLKLRDSGGEAPAAAAPAAAAPAPAAAAPAAAAPAAAAASGMTYGKYDEQMWDGDAKKEIYAAWDPNSPRSPANFNPFETWEGNSPDASGFYPGEGRYKDPARPDVSFDLMMIERAEIEERNANPKPGFVPGCPGCRN
mmetsp:Transcript_32165/g.78150  ORF Transcript_32165/g.78150 Transcript_32165/m.78150 type:complete len:205 (+) Transcript_32165:137-751(+)|eukprot:CAMPEP_0113614000 /NCGR_PEP_ID=MMETSP0017_2-20120614/6935_1 /TAXON_ID=2856 /ORGANISM="Cylindrotheca closterium" /LENGTH=204 /DNA_ID=CAMNT_0000523143 /DNA_START=42 /DNA_END=656 /DNA_ORIENTATION=+ /assembly_acc=CAM_ASM_000147